MESVLQFSVLVWKNMYLRRLRVRPVAFVVEILMAAVPFIKIQNERGIGGNDAVVSSIIYPVYTPDLTDLRLDTVFYGPVNNYSRRIIDTVHSRLPGVAIKTMADEVEMAQLLFSKNVTPNTVGLYFHTESLGDDIPHDLTYTIMFSSGVYEITKARKEVRENGPSQLEDTMSLRVAAVQTAVDLAHIHALERRRSVNHTHEELTVKLRQFPFPTYHEDPDNTMFLMGVRFGVAYALPFCLVITRAIEERQSGMQASVVFYSAAEIYTTGHGGCRKLFTKLMGVPRTWFWLVQFLCAMATWTLSSVLVLAMMSQVNGPYGLAFIFRTNPTLVFTAMLIFNTAYIIIGLFTSLFFDTPSLGLACGLILWTVSLLGPFLSLQWSARTVSAYIATKSSSKLFASVIPIHGLYFFFRIVEFYESYDVPFGWPAIYRKALGRDNVTPFTLMLCMGASAFVFIIGIWYLEAVLPWTNVVPLPLHFPFMASYWNVIVEEVKVAGSQESSHSQEEGHENFEEEPRHLLLVIEVIDMCKVYRRKFAVDHLNMRLYYGQVFVLLGHNGAGKTTICNMLSGFLRPTYGTAIIEGFDLIKNHEDALENVRVCPQKNMLYDELTVYEHLYFFAIIQRISAETIAEQVEIIIKSLHLGPHINTFPRALPQGFRRKLCLAITVIADPKVLILDEPTAGLDPQSRNEVWDLLQKMRRTCTMLLTTHDMEEADVVGDRIAILAEGTIRCCGSSQFLKHRFGTGYHLDIVKRPRRCDVGGVILVVKTYVPTVQLVSESAEILRLSLGVTSSEGFVDMFKVLERFRRKLGIAMLTVSVTTMEDVYLRIADELIEDQEEMLSSGGQKQTQQPVDIKALKEKCAGCAWRKSSLQALRALLRKRWQFVRHQWLLPFLGIIAPAVLLALQGIRESRKVKVAEDVKDVYPYDLRVMYNFSVSAVISADDESLLVSQYYRRHLDQKQIPITRVRDVTDYLLEVGARSMQEYARCAVGGSFFLVGKKGTKQRDPSEGIVQLGVSKDYEGRLAIAWYSGELYHSAVIALNLVHTSLLRWTVGDDTASIKLRVRPQKQLEEAIAYDPDSPEVIQRQLERFTFGAMSVAMMTAACGLFPVVDRKSGCRQLQLLTGLSLRVYWLANFLFDIFVYLLSCCSFFIAMFYYFGNFFIEMTSPIVFIFMCYGICALPMSYLLTLAAGTETTGYALVLLTSFFGAFMQSGTIAFGLLEAAAGIRFVLLNVFPVLRLMPSFALMSAFSKTVSKSQIAYICSRGRIRLIARSRKSCSVEWISRRSCSPRSVNRAYREHFQSASGRDLLRMKQKKVLQEVLRICQKMAPLD
ncbi:hypothetical protein HPB51_023775 [Rhipicephalus microplus]|uniref:ABC transporter domain-containing protein n=1 Tax=Rhipicephalus microplus TaxID=6941 RepID=A0A9J6E4J6_RHIMP|nr:hypothetical protein HPB51_023775 [Rhipicephalus microplus]